jgi:hypothetical protein
LFSLPNGPAVQALIVALHLLPLLTVFLSGESWDLWLWLVWAEVSMDFFGRDDVISSRPPWEIWGFHEAAGHASG